MGGQQAHPLYWQHLASPPPVPGGAKAPAGVTMAVTAAARPVVPPDWPALFEAPEWPLGTVLPLGPMLESAGTARVHARTVAAEWGLSRLADVLQLIVSELVANAVVASMAHPDRPSVLLRLRSDRRRIQVLVWDASAEPPIPAHANPDDETGRGLELVIELSNGTWHWKHERFGGKTCWCIVS